MSCRGGGRYGRRPPLNAARSSCGSARAYWCRSSSAIPSGPIGYSGERLMRQAITDPPPASWWKRLAWFVGILAAIVVVAYVGIQDRARGSALQSSLAQTVTQLEAWKVTNGDIYPASLVAARTASGTEQIGKASCRERGCQYV